MLFNLFNYIISNVNKSSTKWHPKKHKAHFLKMPLYRSHEFGAKTALPATEVHVRALMGSWVGCKNQAQGQKIED
jgi:hypothetical protein